ncbi:hypothetical protein K402DRAFT_198873 [Aulographum hederae CBS 113979]|uniref:Uncharacterized protein n=1 Tax=Aulographum hederae CBS 113979 TaxID=1176131 RepID=A0A6G1HBM9_9PEZI|nr:hypothetical protein K402DRAFT_198873 [Aulographum hederae CBS 113979]
MALSVEPVRRPPIIRPMSFRSAVLEFFADESPADGFRAGFRANEWLANGWPADHLPAHLLTAEGLPHDQPSPTPSPIGGWYSPGSSIFYSPTSPVYSPNVQPPRHSLHERSRSPSPSGPGPWSSTSGMLAVLPELPDVTESLDLTNSPPFEPSTPDFDLPFEQGGLAG